jgi:hypothetical protein
MSSYRVFGPIQLQVTAAGLMTGVSVNTLIIPLDASSFEGTAFQAVWTGNPTGVFDVTASLDYNLPTGNPGHFDSLNPSISNPPAGGPGSAFIPVYASCAKWLQFVYTNVSGVGQLTVYGFQITR